MIRFNQASESEAVLRESLVQAEQAIANPPPPDSTSELKESYYDFTVAALVNAGLELYRFQGEKNAVIKIFQQAAHQSVYLYTNRSQPKPHNNRSLWDFIRHLDIAVCFSDKMYVRFLASLERWKYYHPFNPSLEATAGFIDLLKIYLVTNEVDQAVANQIAVWLDGSQGSNLDKQYVAPQLDALCGIALRDEGRVKMSLGRILDFHARESQEGQYRLLPDAYICLPALRLARLGSQIGLDCSMPSPYLPLELFPTDGSDTGDDIDD